MFIISFKVSELFLLQSFDETSRSEMSGKGEIQY